MKKTFVLSALVFSLVCITSHAEAGKVRVSATIDSKCKSQPAEFTVPKGSKASAFRLIRLDNGQNCVKGGKPDQKGFTIKKWGRIVYSYSQWKNKKQQETPVTLKKLVLGAGVYRVYVTGGKGARASISLSIR